MSTREPRDSDLLTASRIVDEYGLDDVTAESLVKSIARQDGTWVKFDGFRRLFITRGSLEARMRKGPGVS